MLFNFVAGRPTVALDLRTPRPTHHTRDQHHEAPPVPPERDAPTAVHQRQYPMPVPFPPPPALVHFPPSSSHLPGCRLLTSAPGRVLRPLLIERAGYLAPASVGLLTITLNAGLRSIAPRAWRAGGSDHHPKALETRLQQAAETATTPSAARANAQVILLVTLEREGALLFRSMSILPTPRVRCTRIPTAPTAVLCSRKNATILRPCTSGSNCWFGSR